MKDVKPQDTKLQENSKEGLLHVMYGEVYEQLFGDFIEDLLKLDSIAYPGELQGSYKSVNARYQANKDSCMLLVQGAKIVGYLYYFPVTEEFRQHLQISDYILDDDIMPASIAYYQTGDNYLYILSVNIHPEFRDGLGIKYLAQAFLDDIDRKCMQGIHITEMYGTAVSRDGERFLSRLGLKEERTLFDGYKVFRKDN